MGELTGLVAVISPFAFVLALVWMGFYFHKGKGKAAPDTSPLSSDLIRRAEHMEQRIEALERILDNESPGWRHRHDRR